MTHLPGTCEALRKHLQSTWLGQEQAAWSPKCDIVLYPSIDQYRQQLGPGSEQTSGCASLQMDSERVVRRRIDLRVDAADWITSALPHELTHVVVADRFTRRQIPRWADEGMAILAEPHSKQLLRQREMESCIARGHGFTTAELTQVSNYPDTRRRNAFYGQSAALVAHLAREQSPAEFLKGLADPAERPASPAASTQVTLRSWRFLDSEASRGEPKLADRVSRIIADSR